MESTHQLSLVRSAITGDGVATTRILLEVRPRLLAYIQRHLPRELERLVEPNDVLQDTQIEALRRIKSFVEMNDDGFYRWLVTIARRQMLQLLRARKALKRGGGCNQEFTTEFLEELALHERTPSRSATHHELALAVETCLQRIPNDYAVAVRFRYIDSSPVAEIAQKMNRTERAVHMLCNRGLKELRQQLRSMSRFI